MAEMYNGKCHCLVVSAVKNGNDLTSDQVTSILSVNGGVDNWTGGPTLFKTKDSVMSAVFTDGFLRIITKEFEKAKAQQDAEKAAKASGVEGF